MTIDAAATLLAGAGVRRATAGDLARLVPPRGAIVNRAEIKCRGSAIIAIRMRVGWTGGYYEAYPAGPPASRNVTRSDTHVIIGAITGLQTVSRRNIKRNQLEIHGEPTGTGRVVWTEDGAPDLSPNRVAACDALLGSNLYIYNYNNVENMLYSIKMWFSQRSV